MLRSCILEGYYYICIKFNCLGRVLVSYHMIMVAGLAFISRYSQFLCGLRKICNICAVFNLGTTRRPHSGAHAIMAGFISVRAENP